MKRNWFKICNAVEDPDEAEILIYDEIGGWGISARNFVDQLKATGAKKFHLRLNSPGGDVFQGISIYNYLRSLKGNIRVTVDGMAASIASVIAMAGKTITISDGAMMMIHNPWGVVVGGSDDARALADLLDKLRDQIVKAYVGKTGQNEDDLKEWMDEEKWMDAQECVDLGFADSIDSALAVQNFACFNLTKFKNAPTVDINPQSQKKSESKNMNYTFLRKLCAKHGIQFPEKDADVTDAILDRVDGELAAKLTKALESQTKAEKDLKAEQEAHQLAKAAVGTLTTDRDTAKTELATEKAAHAKTKTDMQAALETERNSVKAKVDEELAKLGHRRLPTGTTTEAQMSRAEFDKLTPSAKSEFCKKGGKLAD